MRQKHDTVIAITVTYNRTKTLQKTLESLKVQTYPLEKIIVVDNNSRDEEKKILKELINKDSRINVIWLEDNLGGAGGFEKGMQETIVKYNADWYWIMDDDAYPRKDSLEKLLEKKENLKNIGALCPVAFGIDNQKYQLYHHKRVSKYLMKELPVTIEYDNLQTITQLDANAFVGPLFSKKAVEKLGIPNGNLFIYGDDTEYTYRISREFGVFLIKDAIIDHQDPPNITSEVNPITWWKEYYEIRNKFLFISKYSTSISVTILAKCQLIYILIIKNLATILKKKYKGYKIIRINLLIKAMMDGIRCRSGKTVNPQSYIEKINQLKGNNNDHKN